MLLVAAVVGWFPVLCSVPPPLPRCTRVNTATGGLKGCNLSAVGHVPQRGHLPCAAVGGHRTASIGPRLALAVAPNQPLRAPQCFNKRPWGVQGFNDCGKVGLGVGRGRIAKTGGRGGVESCLCWQGKDCQDLTDQCPPSQMGSAAAIVPLAAEKVCQP